MPEHLSDLLQLKCAACGSKTFSLLTQRFSATLVLRCQDCPLDWCIVLDDRNDLDGLEPTD